jgi:hypothetical protein
MVVLEENDIFFIILRFGYMLYRICFCMFSFRQYHGLSIEKIILM